MDIPPEKKPLFYLVSVPVFLIGLVLGVFIAGYIFFQTRDTVCPMWQTPPKVNTDLTSQQIQQAVSPEQNKNMFGKVTAKDTSSFTLQLFVVNPLDSKNSTTTSVKIPFDPKLDAVVTLKKATNSSTIKETPAVFDAIKVGQQVLVKVLDGKKTVYITPS
ncbi:MAG: hypothetical protein Q7S75_00030 [bacterium]|nr:hypothetical protein [bacterium]